VPTRLPNIRQVSTTLPGASTYLSHKVKVSDELGLRTEDKQVKHTGRSRKQEPAIKRIENHTEAEKTKAADK